MKRFINKNKVLILVAVFILGWSTQNQLSAQEGIAGTQPILHEAGVNARAYALGRAYVALANDPSAVFWNPAGLEHIPKISFSLFHTPLIVDGTSYDFAGFVYPTLQLGTVGIGFSRIGVGDIVVTDEANQPITNDASFDYNELYLSYAKKIPFNLTPGFTFKVQRQAFSQTGQVTSAFGFDAGLLYRSPFESALLRDLSVGFHIQNLVKQQLKLGPHDDPIANQITFGIFKRIPLGFTGKLNIVADYVHGEFEGGSFHAGTEYIFKNMGTLRLGFDNNSPAFGAGVTYNFIQIDYSFGNLSDDSEFPPTHRFSLTFEVGKSRAEKIAIAQEERRKRELELIAQTREEERQRRIAEHMKKGKDYLENEQYFDARSEFQQAIAEDPLNQEANSLLDQTEKLIQKELENERQEAIAQAVDKELEKENQRIAREYFEEGKRLLENKQYTRAIVQFNLALERAPDSAPIKDALNSAKRQLNAEVRNLVNDAREEFQSGNYANALQILSDARVLAPEDQELKEQINTLANRIKYQQYFQEALILLDIGDYQKALSLFEEALKLDPNNERLRQYISEAKRGMSTKREEMDPESNKKFYEGMDRFLAGDYEAALNIWRALEEKYPFNTQLQNAIKTAEERLERAQ